MTRLIAALILIVFGNATFAGDKHSADLEKIQSASAEARKAAAGDPTIKNAASAPVRLYLVEQQRRRLTSLAGLRQRIEQYQSDETKKSLVPVLKEQLAELEAKPLEPVNFDSAYGYGPTTGLVGYSKRVRLLENTADGKSIIQVDGIALLVEGLGTSQYASGKFLYVDKAILIGPLAPITSVQGMERTVYNASLVDLEAVLRSAAK